MAKQLTITLRLQRQLILADQLLAFGMTLPMTKDLHSIKYPRDAVVTTVALFTKAHVTFRSIIVLCKNGLDRPATALTRSLFETMLNLAFLLRKQVSLHRFHPGQANPKTALNLHGERLTPEFRHALFNTWSLLRDEKTIANWQTTPGIKQRGKRVLKKLTQLDRSYMDTISSAWQQSIKGSNTCTGLSVFDFAASLGFQKWYRTIYAGDSAFVHQSDVVSYLSNTRDGDFAPRLFMDARDVSGVLLHGATLYFCCIHEMHKRFRFGQKADKPIQKFEMRLTKW